MSETVATNSDATPECYHTANVQLFPAGEHLFLVSLTDGQHVRFLREESVSILLHCKEYKTLEEHALTYCNEQQLDPSLARPLRRELQRLVGGGYLVAQSQMFDRLRRFEAQKPAGRISAIGFPTCNRVTLLQRCLKSYIEHCSQFNRKLEYVVMDDSPDTEVREAYKQMLRELKKQYAVCLSYAGLEEKQAYARKLAREGGIPEETAFFALAGNKRYEITTIGSNRNALLLHTVGELLLSADDDTVCQVAPSPDQHGGVAFISGRNPLETWFFPDRESALQSMNSTEQDLLAVHEQWLGREVETHFFPSELKMSGQSITRSLHRRLNKQPGKIAVTFNGIVGDCCWDNPDFHLFQQGETFRRLTQSERVYRAARNSREVVQVTNQTTLTNEALVMFSTCMGLDNRSLLPPFTPLGRAEDIGFGMMLAACFSMICTAYLPWVVQHLPGENRSFQEMQMFGIGFNDWIPALIGTFDPGFTSTPQECLVKLGRYLKEIGCLSPSAFEELARVSIWEHMSSLVSNLEERLHNSQEPVFWQQDVRALIARARQSALMPLQQMYLLKGGWEQIQYLLVLFGATLEWWPVMVETARRLRLDGCRLAQALS
jgi:hypothetical protein